MAAKFVSKLSILLGINASGVSSGAAKAEGEVRKFSKKVDGAARNTSQFAGAQDLAGRAAAGLSSRLSSLATGFAGMVAASAAAAVSIGKMTEAFSRIDKLAKTADKLGETTEALAGFQLAAELTGVGGDQAAVALQRMTRRISQAADGSGEAVAALQELGLSAQQLEQMTPTQAFAAISAAMQGVESQSDRVRLAFKLFDSEGVALVNTMALGADGLSKVQAEAERLGLTVDRSAAGGVEAANDAITKFNASLDGIANQFATALAPAVEMAATHLTDFVVEIMPDLVELFKELQPFIQVTITSFTQTAKLAIALASVIAKLANVIASLANQMGISSSAMRLFQTPLAAVAEAIGFIDRPARKAAGAVESLAASVKKAAIDPEQFETLDAVDKLTDKLDEAKAAADEWARIGERITESVQTPAEKAAEEVAQIEEALSRGVISWETYQRAIEQATASLDEMKTSSVPGGPVAVGAAVRGTTSGMEQVQRSREAGYQMVDLAKRSAERDQLRNRILDQLLENMRDVNRKTPNNPDRIEVNEVRI